MDLHRLPADLAAQAHVDAGHVRLVTRGPRTVEQVLTDARSAMEAQDERERQAADPLHYVRAGRRRTLLVRLLYGKG